MIPQNRLSTTTVFGTLLTPNPQPSDVISKELGGVALQNPNEGLRVKVWTCTVVQAEDPLDPDLIQVEAVDVPPVTIISAVDVTEVCLAFDQNMRPFIAFVAGGIAKFYWYDSLVEAPVVTTLPAGTITPRATLDDTRLREDGVSDILLVYIIDGNLVYRQERDRYQIEYLLRGDITTEIINPRVKYVGMQLNYRVQIAVEGDLFGS